jgi:hypothetical protein
MAFSDFSKKGRISLHMSKEIIRQIDAAIKSIWLNEIPQDYSERYLMKEDTLKNALYYHLRSKLDELLQKHDLRIFTEFNNAGIKEKGYRADLAIVKVPKIFEGFMGSVINPEDVYALVELKYVAHTQGDINAVNRDVKKLKQYVQKNEFPNCQYYLGVIQEASAYKSGIYWFDKRQTNNWADGRVTELGACYIIDNDEKMGFTVTSYNGLNPRLSRSDKKITPAELGV